MFDQNEDGTPHMTIYDYRRQASFVWDGKSRELDYRYHGQDASPAHTGAV